VDDSGVESGGVLDDSGVGCDGDSARFRISSADTLEVREVIGGGGVCDDKCANDATFCNELD